MNKIWFVVLFLVGCSGAFSPNQHTAKNLYVGDFHTMKVAMEPTSVGEYLRVLPESSLFNIDRFEVSLETSRVTCEVDSEGHSLGRCIPTEFLPFTGPPDTMK